MNKIRDFVEILAGILVIYMYLSTTEYHNMLLLSLAIIFILCGVAKLIIKQIFMRNIINASFYILISLSLFISYLFIKDFHTSVVLLFGTLCFIGGIITLIWTMKSKKD